MAWQHVTLASALSGHPIEPVQLLETAHKKHNEMKAWKYSKPVLKITPVLGLWTASL